MPWWLHVKILCHGPYVCYCDRCTLYCPYRTHMYTVAYSQQQEQLLLMSTFSRESLRGQLVSLCLIEVHTSNTKEPAILTTLRQTFTTTAVATPSTARAWTRGGGGRGLLRRLVSLDYRVRRMDRTKLNEIAVLKGSCSDSTPVSCRLCLRASSNHGNKNFDLATAIPYTPPLSHRNWLTTPARSLSA